MTLLVLQFIAHCIVKQLTLRERFVIVWAALWLSLCSIKLALFPWFPQKHTLVNKMDKERQSALCAPYPCPLRSPTASSLQKQPRSAWNNRPTNSFSTFSKRWGVYWRVGTTEQSQYETGGKQLASRTSFIFIYRSSGKLTVLSCGNMERKLGTFLQPVLFLMLNVLSVNPIQTGNYPASPPEVV